MHDDPAYGHQLGMNTMSRNGTASIWQDYSLSGLFGFSDTLETILEVTGGHYGFLGALRFSERGQGCIMTPRSVVLRAHQRTQCLDRFERTPVFPHSEDLFYRAIVMRGTQVLRRPESILERFGLLPPGISLAQRHLVVIPTNTDCTPRGLLGLVCDEGFDPRHSLLSAKGLVAQCGMLLEASNLGLE